MKETNVLNQGLEISISKASLEDLDAMLEIEYASFLVPWSRKSLEVEVEGNEFSVTLVARSVGNFEGKCALLGYVCIWLVFEELRFLNLAVSPRARRQGIASKLVKRAIFLGLSKGARRALLEVRESNQSAQLLYEKFGFNVYARRKSYYTNPNEDAILMSLDPCSDPVVHTLT